MKSISNRYRPPRTRYDLDASMRKQPRPHGDAHGTPQYGKQALGFGKKKKGKS
jgi:hypothetical protein